jgi:hypothetical protein
VSHAMKNAGALVGLVLLLLAGLALALFLGPLAQKPGMRGVEDGPAAAAAPVVNKATPAEPTAAAEGDGGSTGAEVSAPKSQPATRQPFPAASDIPSGMERSRLQALFGPPEMHTISVEQGVQLETWVYLRSEPEAVTFVLLRAGRVASATTTAY